MPLDLVVLDSLAPPDAPPEMRALRLPALERWLASAEVGRHEGDAMAWLASRFHLSSPVPVAPIALAAESVGPTAGAWLRADPVHVRIGQTSAVLERGSRLGISADEAGALAAMLSAHFREDGLAFIAASPDRWYVSVPAGELPETPASADAMDPRALGALPISRGRINWRSTLTEAQMLLSSDSVNAAREARGAPAINSLWLWGGGEWPVKAASPYAAIYADDVFARGLGMASGARLHGVPGSIGEVEAGTAASLVVLESLWSNVILERDWFEPLRGIFKRLEPVRLVLGGPKGTIVANLKRPSLLDRFRGTKPLTAYA